LGQCGERRRVEDLESGDRFLEAAEKRGQRVAFQRLPRLVEHGARILFEQLAAQDRMLGEGMRGDSDGHPRIMGLTPRLTPDLTRGLTPDLTPICVKILALR